MKKITIIITLYNRLENCLRILYKLKDQIEENKAEDLIQIVVINDGSFEELAYLDAIVDLCNKYGFDYYYQENGGEAVARNAGLDKVNATYFTYVDCDDDIVPDYIRNILEESKYDYDAVAFKWIYKDDKKEGQRHPKPLVNWNVWSWLFKTEYFSKFRFDEKRIIASDYFYLEEAINDKLNIYYADDKTTIIYNANNPNNLTNRFSRGEVEANKEER